MMAHACYKTQRGCTEDHQMLKLLFILWKEEEDLASGDNFIDEVKGCLN